MQHGADETRDHRGLCTGDRSIRSRFVARSEERAEITTTVFDAIPGITVRTPEAAFYAMPKVSLPPGRTDEDYVLALSARPACCACTDQVWHARGRRLSPDRVSGLA